MRKFTVKALSVELDRMLGRTFPVVLVEGEVAQLHTPRSGHLYFVLRDYDATLNAVMWRTQWQGSRYRPKVGDRVLCRGRLGVYGQQGRYQLYTNVMEPVGAGKLQIELAKRKARLEQDGLLDPRRKRPLPTYPRIIGVATSPTGAALQDFLEVSGQRWPSARILVSGCVVQGPQAPPSVVRAVELLLQDGRSEVIVVTRGGGSKEDLLPFHDEQLARFLAHSPIPVVSAVGHQIDTTLADLVADAVAPTPSAAALLVTPDGPALAQRIDELALGMAGSTRRIIQRQHERVDGLQRRLRHPGQRLSAIRRQRLDLLERLRRAMRRQLDGDRMALERLSRRLEPETRRVVQRQRRGVELLQGRLEALSPYAVLDRGYAIVTTSEGQVVTDPEAVGSGDPVRVRVAGGTFGATVE